MEDRTKALQKHWRWLFLSGMLTLVLGVLAIIVPLRSSLAFDIGIGTVFACAGLIQAVHSFWSLGWGGFYFESLGGVLYLLVGIMLLGNPGAGVKTVTLLLALLLIMQGMIQFILSSELKQKLSKGWMFTSGVAAVGLGVLIWSQWPSGALWLVGLFIGIHLLLRGCSIVTIALSERLATGKETLVLTPE